MDLYMTRFRVGDTVYFNRYSATTWYKGVILSSRGVENYTIEYPNSKGKLKKEVVPKTHMIKSRGKKMVEFREDLTAGREIIFFTQFDKMSCYGTVEQATEGLIKVRSSYPGSESYEVFFSSILIPENR